MIKIRWLLLTLFAFLFMSTYRLNAQESVNAEISTLVAGNWGKVGYFGLSIEFSHNGEFRASYFDMSSSWTKRGRYAICDGKIDLITISLDGKEEPLAIGGLSLFDHNSLEYPYRLDFNFGDYLCTAYDLSRPRSEGEAVSVGGVKAIAMGIRKGHTTNDVKCRDAPTLSSSIVEADLEDPVTGEQRMIPYVPKGRALKVLARTSAMERVQSWTNYWYYVEFEYIAGPPDPVRGWMFGEFISIDG